MDRLGRRTALQEGPLLRRTGANQNYYNYNHNFSYISTDSAGGRRCRGPEHNNDDNNNN